MMKGKSYILLSMLNSTTLSYIPDEIRSSWTIYNTTSMEEINGFFDSKSFDAFAIELDFLKDKGNWIIEKVKSIDPHLPVYAFVHNEKSLLEKMFSYIDFYTIFPSNQEQIIWAFRKMEENIKLNDSLKDLEFYKNLSKMDGLTELYNHRHFQDMIIAEINRGLRYGSRFSLAMMDLDNFKYFNDTNGHLAGDSALRKISHLLRKNARSSDIIARYGGDEFSFILPDTLKKSAILMVDRIRRLIEREGFDGRDGNIFKITSSIGIAQYPVDGSDRDSLINSADKALFKAKKNGGNQIWYMKDGKLVRYEPEEA